MTSLLFIRKSHVYLPEIPAYRQYLAAHYPQVKVFESTAVPDADPAAYDIAWYFMGIDTKGAGKYVVHEYNSLSTQPLAKVKNIIKRSINEKPQRRIFLNERVRRDFGFHDNVPDHIRDMGIDARFFDIKRSTTPAYDFIYAGGLNRGPVIQLLLDRFTRPLREAKILLVGDAPPELVSRYKEHKNIVFHGRVPYEQVPGLMAQARYGLNIMPDIYPFNMQTATKVFEYCAAGLPVITTDYGWIGTFERAQQAKFFRLSADCSNLTMDALAKFDFRIPDVNAFRWERVIADSAIFSFLEK